MTANAIDLTTLAKIVSWLSMGQSGTTFSLSNVPAQEQQNIQDCITAASAYWIEELGFSPPGGVAPIASPLNSAQSYTEILDGSGSERQFTRIRPIIAVSSLSVDGTSIPASSGYPAAGYVIDNSGKSISIVSGFGPPAGGRPLTVGFNFLRSGRSWFFRAGIQNVQITYTAGFAAQTITNELDLVPAGSSPTITVNVLPWFTDLGAKYFASGNPLTKVNTAPNAGQYYLEGGGVYLFNSADSGQQMQISYTATGVPFDIEMAVRQMVSVNYKRREWIDVKSNSMANGAGTTSFRDWELPPEVERVLNRYRRRALA